MKELTEEQVAQIRKWAEVAPTGKFSGGVLTLLEERAYILSCNDRAIKENKELRALLNKMDLEWKEERQIANKTIGELKHENHDLKTEYDKLLLEFEAEDGE